MNMETTPLKFSVLIWLRKQWIHILIWVAMLLYVVMAPAAYARFILRDGKPIYLDLILPHNSDKIMYSVDRLDPIIFHGQSLYDLWGWAFIEDTNQSLYERYIVLRSEAKTYFFPVVSSNRPDVQSAFSSMHLDILYSGFITYIAKDDIERGSYRVGVLFRHKNSSLSVYYIDTNSNIIRTANQLKLSK